MKKILSIILLLILIIIVFQLSKKIISNTVIENKIKFNLEDYSKSLDSIKIEKIKIKDNSINEIGIKFTYLLTNKIFPYWYGTKWDFNGTTQKPNKGYIACGYFVTTTLRDMGVEINRVKLAQCASEEMIKNLVSDKNIIRFSNKSIEEFEKTLQNRGYGIYIVGLDNHTGFVLLNSEGSFFIHSSGIAPHKVVKEKLLESPLIVNSKYRIVGKLSADKKLLTNWIKN